MRRYFQQNRIQNLGRAEAKNGDCGQTARMETGK